MTRCSPPRAARHVDRRGQRREQRGDQDHSVRCLVMRDPPARFAFGIEPGQTRRTPVGAPLDSRRSVARSVRMSQATQDAAGHYVRFWL